MVCDIFKKGGQLSFHAHICHITMMISYRGLILYKVVAYKYEQTRLTIKFIYAMVTISHVA
jgi:hypothetical protein